MSLEVTEKDIVVLLDFIRQNGSVIRWKGNMEHLQRTLEQMKKERLIQYIGEPSYERKLPHIGDGTFAMTNLGYDRLEPETAKMSDGEDDTDFISIDDLIDNIAEHLSEADDATRSEVAKRLKCQATVQDISSALLSNSPKAITRLANKLLTGKHRYVDDETVAVDYPKEEATPAPIM